MKPEMKKLLTVIHDAPNSCLPKRLLPNMPRGFRKQVEKALAKRLLEEVTLEEVVERDELDAEGKPRTDKVVGPALALSSKACAILGVPLKSTP